MHMRSVNKIDKHVVMLAHHAAATNVLQSADELCIEAHRCGRPQSAAPAAAGAASRSWASAARIDAICFRG